ncbi:MAG: Hsp20 family protein [Alistipes senegalensis]
MVPARRNQNWLPSIFSTIFWATIGSSSAATPPLRHHNILENDDEYKVEVAAPGMTRNFKVHLNEDNELIISSMEKKNESKEEDKEHKGTYLRREFSYTQFQQSLLLPNVKTQQDLGQGRERRDDHRDPETQGDGGRCRRPTNEIK